MQASSKHVGTLFPLVANLELTEVGRGCPRRSWQVTTELTRSVSSPLK